jgi:hypothetical protein
MATMNQQPTFWFGARRYGFGWGPPVRWQGWAVLVVYFVLLFGGVYYFKAQRSASALLTYVVLLTAALVAIIFLTGERPLRWRWGGK